MDSVEDNISSYERLHAKVMRKNKKNYEQLEKTTKKERVIKCKVVAWFTQSPKLVQQKSTSNVLSLRFSWIGFMLNLIRSVTSLHCLLAPTSFFSPKINK